jgi:hypothetical protein
MIKLILLPLAVLLSCGSTKTSQSDTNTETVVAGSQQNAIGQDSIDKKLAGKMPSVELVMPACIKNKIDSFKLKEAHEKPQRVIEYTYKGKKVYYVVMPCCDFFNEVYDDQCNFLGAPDGGFTGKGDGKLPDFFTEVKNEKLVWGTPK